MEIRGYEDLDFVGAGGNAHVYRAIRRETNDVVAIKVLLTAGDQVANDRFEHARKTLAELEALPNVVPVYETGLTTAGDPFVVTPFYSGGSLQTLLEDSALEWRVAVGYVQKIADALALAHANEILHLDMRPANILLDDEGEPWLTNFATSELVSGTGSFSAQMLTPAFTPPERLDGEPATATTDIYGLGATLFALLAGNPPFFHESRTTPVSVIMAAVNDPVPVHELPADVPGSVRNLLMRVMAKEADKRPSSATEFSSLLDEVLAGNPIPARSTGVRRPEVDAPPPVVSGIRADTRAVAIPPVTSPGQGRRPFPVMWVAAGVMFLLFTSGGAFALAQGRPSADDVATSASESLDPIVAETTTMTSPSSTSTSTSTSSSSSTSTTSTSTTSTSTSTSSTTSTSTSTSSTTSTTTTTVDSQTTVAPDALGPIVAGFVHEIGTGGNEQTVTFENATTGDAVAYQWDFGDGGVSAEVSPTHVFASSGSFEVTLVAFGLEGARDEVARTVQVPGNPPEETPATAPSSTTTTTEPATVETPPSGPVFAGFIAAAGPPGDEQTLSFQNTSRGEAVRYEWNFGDGGTSTAAEPTHTYETPGSYSVTITAFAADGTSNSATHPVRVDANT